MVESRIAFKCSSACVSPMTCTGVFGSCESGNNPLGYYCTTQYNFEGTGNTPTSFTFGNTGGRKIEIIVSCNPSIAALASVDHPGGPPFSLSVCLHVCMHVHHSVSWKLHGPFLRLFNLAICQVGTYI